jgi:hypothetical protein
MSLVRAREFLLGAYHDLPNVLFVGALLIGSLTGQLSLVWVALGLVINGLIVAGFQGLFGLFFPMWAQVAIPAGAGACSVLGRTSLVAPDETQIVAPSYWLSSAIFFAAFSIYNSLRVALKESPDGAEAQKVDNRRAVSLSVAAIGVLFLGLALARGYSGCETLFGGALSVALGTGVAIGYWHLLDACGNGIMPDILGIMGNLAPGPKDGENKIPIVCAPET